jgi:hypothetical protein
MTQATTIEQLQLEAAALVGRVEAKAAEQATLLTQWADLVGRLVDATAGERPAILKQRAALEGERSALADELAVLKQRRDVADLAPFLFLEGQAQEQAEVTGERETAARVANSDVLAERMRRHNNPTRERATAESDKEMVDLEVKVARVGAAALIAARDHTGARNLLEKARADTAAEVARQAGTATP